MSVTNLQNLKIDDFTTSYDVSGGAKLFKVPVRKGITYSLQAIWAGLDQLDASIQLQGSNNDVDFDDLPPDSSKTLDTASDSVSFRDRNFDHANFGVQFEPGAATTGTLILLFKPRI